VLDFSHSACCEPFEVQRRGLIGLIRSATALTAGARLQTTHWPDLPHAAYARCFNYASDGGGCDVTCKSHRRDEISRSWRDHAGDLCRPGNDPHLVVQTNRSSATDMRSETASPSPSVRWRQRSHPTLKLFMST